MVALLDSFRIVLVVAGVALLALAGRAYRTQKPTNRSFGALIGLLGVTAFCLGLSAGTGAANKLVWTVTNLSIPVAVLAFSFNYYGITLFTSRARMVAVLTPAVIGLGGSSLLILGTPASTPGTTAPLGTLASFPASVYDVAFAFDRIGFYYTAFVIAVAVGLVALNVLRYDHLDARLAGAVAFIGAWPWLGNFLWPEVAARVGSLEGFGVLTAGYATSAAVGWFVVGPLGLLDSSPAAANVGADRALDSMDDAVIITDDNETVLRLNAVACETFGVAERSAVGQPLSTVIDSAETPADGELTAIGTTDGVRQFEVTRSAVTTGGGHERGTVLVLRDVTRRQTREQRLAVLNRVLRHNLRNNATSIIGRAQLISDGQQAEVSAEQIIETTQELVGTAETARDIENMMSEDATVEGVRVARVVDRIVADVQASFPEVEVTAAVPEDAMAAVGPHAFETVMYQLVENAAEHNDADEPIVVVSVEETEEGLTVGVSDNGPGIPDHEQAVLDAGQEDQLSHGSGLGLWAVHWGITQMGGRLTIAENDPRGTQVTFTVPTGDETVPVAATTTDVELSVSD